MDNPSFDQGQPLEPLPTETPVMPPEPPKKSNTTMWIIIAVVVVVLCCCCVLAAAGSPIRSSRQPADLNLNLITNNPWPQVSQGLFGL